MKALNLGCGKKKIENAINLDVTKTTKPDIIFDLNKFPYPFKNNSFDIIYTYEVMEHLDIIIKVMEELHRILKPDGILIITTPHFSSPNSFTDITHKHHFTSKSFNFFTDESTEEYYSKIRFKKIKFKLNFYTIYKILGVAFLANKFPIFYEKYFPYIFPAQYIYLELRALK